jgi:hypothetical protein
MDCKLLHFSAIFKYLTLFHSRIRISGSASFYRSGSTKMMGLLLRNTLLKYFMFNFKGMGTLLKILHLSYSFGQKCSKLGTFTVKGLKIQKRE